MEIEDNEQEILLEQENISVGGGAVNSVNGQVGDVVLTTSDLENDSDYQTGSEVESAISTAVATETTNREAADTALQTAIANETTARETADTNLQSQIDGITASSDVTDIVGTYAQLQAYDTSTLGNNDIIKVLQDESRNNETTYYRWSTSTQSFTLIGEEGPYYTKSQADALLNAKQNTLTAGDGINISNDEISGVDFVGTDGTAAGEAGLVPAPAITDAGKFLKADGTWDDAGSTINVVQSTGISTTDVMSQNATTSMVFANSSTANVKIGGGTTVTSPSGVVVIGDRATGVGSGVAIGNRVSAGNNCVAIGGQAISSNYSVAVGEQSYSNPVNGIAIGRSANAGNRSGGIAIGANAAVGGLHPGSVALGATSICTRSGEVYIGPSTTDYGYNSTNYRVLGGVHDPVDDHDAANKVYVDTAVAGAGGGGGVKILTADDYNWNSTTNTAVEPFDSVALWLLDSGVYMRTDSSVVTYKYINGGQMLVNEVYILGSNDAVRPIVYYNYADIGSGRERFGYVDFVYSSASTLSGQLYKSLPMAMPVNNLTSTSTSYPLSAKQGKVLDDKITALEARVAALEGN